MDDLKNKVFSGFIWKFLERFFVQFVTFVVSLVVARILAPEDYGLVAMVTVFINIAMVVVSNGFNAALIQSPNADEKDFSTLFYLSFCLSIVLYFILFFFAPQIASFYNQEELTSIVKVLGLILPISSITSIQNAYVGRMMIFKKNFVASLFSSLFSGALGIFMALKGFGVWALVFQMLSSSLLVCLIQCFTISWKPIFYFSIKRSVPLLRFGANSLGADIIGTVFNQLNSFVMGKWYSASQLAYYNRGQSFPYLINGNVSVIVSNVMFSAFSKRSNDLFQLKKMLKKTITLYSYILTPLYVGMFAISENMVELLLTEKWLPALPYLKIVCIACILGTISPLDIVVLKSIGKSDVVFHLEFIKKPIWILLLLLGACFNSYVLASVLIFATLMELIVNSIFVNKYLKYSLLEKMFDWGKTLIPSVIMFVIVYFLNFLQIKLIILVPCQIIVGVIVYVLYSVLTKNECFLYIKNLIKLKNGVRNEEK